MSCLFVFFFFSLSLAPFNRQGSQSQRGLIRKSSASFRGGG